MKIDAVVFNRIAFRGRDSVLESVQFQGDVLLEPAGEGRVQGILAFVQAGSVEDIVDNPKAAADPRHRHD